MIEIASVFLTEMLSTAVSGVAEKQSVTIRSGTFDKTKELLAKQENKHLYHDIETIITAGYFFGLYYCTTECSKDAKKTGDNNLVAKLNTIEGLIDEKQKSNHKQLWRRFSDASKSVLPINKTHPEKTKIPIDILGDIELPTEFLKKVDKHLYQKLKSYFIDTIKTSEHIQSFLNSGDQLVSSNQNDPDRGYHVKLNFTNKYPSLIGVTPLNEALTVNTCDLPSEMTALYYQWKDNQSGPEHDNTEEYDDVVSGMFPLELTGLSFNKDTAEFIITDDIGTCRLFFIIRHNETPHYRYPVQIEPISQDIKDSKVYRTYAVPNSYRISDTFFIASVILHTDHAILQVIHAKDGMLIDKFNDSEILKYISGNEIGEELEQGDAENEIFYCMDNPDRFLIFIDVKEKKLFHPKVKYDYSIHAQYGAFRVKRSCIYLLFQPDCSSNDDISAFEFYKSIHVEASKQPKENDIPVKFAGIIKSRLDKLYDLYQSGPYRANMVKYFNELFRWTTLAANNDCLEKNMDHFITVLNNVMKAEKDRNIILGLSDLQACAIYNKCNIYKHSGEYRKAADLCRQSIKIIKTIFRMQPDYPIKRPLSFFENALTVLYEMGQK